MVTDKKKNHPYEDILYTAHHVSSSREHMSLHDRAAQFSPFAAVAGYESAMKETERLTDQRIELDEYEKTILDEKIRMIQAQLEQKQEIEFIYFCPDHRKSGGAYLTVSGAVKKIEEYSHQIILQDGRKIPIDEIVEISIIH